MILHRALIALALLAPMVGLMAQQAEGPPKPGDAGRSPDGVEFQVPELKAIAMAQPQPLRVESLEVHELAEDTDTGNPGDLLLTFHGQGFLSTAKSPQLELAGGEIVFDDTLVNLDGSHLFVVISHELIPDIERLNFEEIIIHNPGGLEDTEYSQASLKMTPGKLLRLEAGAAQARMVYRKGEFVRELVER